ncbi:MAG TPA: ATP-binding protein [Pyrinomonadaceae bacterium]|nr:ATP-binding protein [Pyrinomonadaceae bacterium]
MSIVTDSPVAAPPAGIGSVYEFEAVSQSRVLIVDDSRLVRSVFSGALAGTYDCVTAGSYDEALECMRLYEFDLVLADVIMPGLSGIELLRKIVATYPETAVIMVSSVDRPQRALDALRLGAVDYLIKPCELPVLQLSVERALERRRLLLDAKRHKAELEKRNAELIAGRAELQRLQSQVVHNEKMIALGRVAAGLAHELNNPVAFLHGNLDLLKDSVSSIVDLISFYESLDLDASVRAKAVDIKNSGPYSSAINDLGEIIGDCADGAERIRDIVNNLRTFSRLDEAEFKKADVSAGIASTLRLLAPYFNNGRIEVMLDIDDVPEVDSFGGQLNQIWMNLLVNAAQAIGDRRGIVRICLRRESDHVVVTIGDNGPGIARQDLDRIFDPFFTTKDIGEGTGLGLSIVFGIVERHGGTISVDSALGEGTAFTVRLPINIRLDDKHTQRGIDIFNDPHITV